MHVNDGVGPISLNFTNVTLPVSSGIYINVNANFLIFVEANQNYSI